MAKKESNRGFPGFWRKLAEGKYQLVIDLGHDFKGKRIRPTQVVYVESDKKADTALLNFWIENKDKVIKYDGNTALGALTEKYIDLKFKGKKTTKSGYQSIIRTSIKPFWWKTPVKKITPLHIDEWVKHFEDEGKSPKTIRNRFALLNSVFESCVEWKAIKENPCKNTRLPEYRPPEADYYNQSEVAELIERLLKLDDAGNNLVFKAVIIMELFSGLRKGELYGAEWAKINLKNGIVDMGATRYYTPEDGNFIDTPKSDAGNRTVTLPKLCLVLLRRLKKQQNETRLKLGEKWGPDEGLVMLNPYTGKPLGTGTLYDWFVEFLKKEKLRRPKRALHALRHTNVSMVHSLNPDISPTELSKWIGHAKPSTTLNIYDHLFKEDSGKEIADKLNGAYGAYLVHDKGAK